jgi:hypothetical protein
MTEDEMTYVEGGASKKNTFLAETTKWAIGIITGAYISSAAILAHIELIIGAFKVAYAAVAVGIASLTPVFIAAAGVVLIGTAYAVYTYGRTKKWWK